MVSTRSQKQGVSVSSQLFNSLNISSQSQREEASHGNDFNQMSAHDLISSIIARNRDPVIDQMLRALSDKIPKDFSDAIEAEKRARSLVISGIEEPDQSLGASEKSRFLQERVNEILDVLNVDCAPSEVFWMGKFDPSRKRLVKVLLPSTYYWKRALANARMLRSSDYSGVFIRKSMTEEERRHEYELRQIARERNRGKANKEWVVYRGQLTLVSDLARRKSGNA